MSGAGASSWPDDHGDFAVCAVDLKQGAGMEKMEDATLSLFRRFGQSSGQHRVRKLVAEIDRARASEARLTAEVERLREVCEAFARTAEDATRAHEAPKTGMQVPFHGDFAGAKPSTIINLRWWAREFRAALAATKNGGEG